MSFSSLFRLRNQMQSVMNDMNALFYDDPFLHLYPRHAFVPRFHHHRGLLDDDMMDMEPLFSPTLLLANQHQQQQQQQQQNLKDESISNALTSPPSTTTPSATTTTTTTTSTEVAAAQAQQRQLSSSFPSLRSFVQCRCDVHEDKEKFVVTAELPGVSKEAVSVELRDGFITIIGSKKEELSDNNDNDNDNDNANAKENENAASKRKSGSTSIRRSERRFGSFTRSFRLPSSCDRDDVSKVNAKFENGVITISIAKKTEKDAEEMPRSTQVPIQFQ